MIELAKNTFSAMDDVKAREILGIKESEWIVTVENDELALMKAALNLHAELATALAKKGKYLMPSTPNREDAGT